MFDNQRRCTFQGQFEWCAHLLKKQDRGQSLMELAIIMPIFVIILLGLIQLGTMRYAEILMHMAARHGARVESLNGNGKIAISEYLSKHSCIDMDDISVMINKRFFEPATVIHARIVYRMQPMPLFGKVFPEGFSIQVSYVF